MNQSIFPSIPGNVFWPYLAGIMVLAIGLFRYSEEFLRAHRIDKLLTLGPLFFAIPMAVFAAQHFTEAKAVAGIVPSWIPGSLFWTYFVGVALLAASLSFAVKKHVAMAAILLATMLLLFVLLIHVRGINSHPKNVISWAIAFRDLAFSGGAMALAAAQAEKPASTKGAAKLTILARILLAVPAIFFGLEHMLHPDFMPGVDLDKNMPAWIPAHTLWGYLAGAVFFIGGTCLIVNRKTRFAATSLGIMSLLLIAFVYLPIVVVNPSDINDGLNFLVSTLAFSGAALLLAKAMPDSLHALG